jgi:hypothetical protein
MTENIRARSQPPFRSSSLSPLYQLRFLTSGCDVGVLHCIRSPTIPYTSGPFFCLVAPCFCPCFAHCRPAIVLLHAARINLTLGLALIRGRWTPAYRCDASICLALRGVALCVVASPGRAPGE